MIDPASLSAPGLTDRLAALKAATGGQAGPPPAFAREADTASLSLAGRRLGELHGVLARLRAAFASAKAGGFADAQGQIDKAVAHLGASGATIDADRISLSPWVKEATLSGTGLGPQDRLDLVLEVQSEPQFGELFISVPGGPHGIIDTDGGALTVEVEGGLGAKAMSFASGQTLAQVAAAFNAHADVTGVEASVLDDGVLHLRSTHMGSGDFVSIRHIEGQSNLSYSTPDPSGAPVHELIHTAGQRQDYGQDLRAHINGRPVATYGNRLAFVTPDVIGFMTLDPGLFDQPGLPPPFVAAVIQPGPGGG